jgi:tetratricopeptide (TPR) repeat protein
MIRRAIALLILLGLPTISAWAGTFAFDRYEEAGRMALWWGENAEGLRLYRLALSEASSLGAAEQGLALEGLARASMRSGDVAQAGSLLAKADELLKNDPQYPLFQLDQGMDRAEWLQDSGRYAAAQEELDSLEVKIRAQGGPGSPNLPPLWLRRGRLESLQHQLVAAEADFQRARDLSETIWDGVNPWYLASLKELVSLAFARHDDEATRRLNTEMDGLLGRVGHMSALREHF